MKFRTAYKDKIQSPFSTVGPSMTRQSMTDECNINFIIDKFQKTGVITHEKEYKGDYGEFENMDFHEAMNIVADANSMFETVPSSIRKEFDNDPGKFLAFVQDDKNRDRMHEMGLLVDRPAISQPEAPAAEPQTEPNGEEKSEP